MCLQEYKIHLVDGRGIRAVEEVNLPSDQLLYNRFRNSKADDVLTVGSDDTSKAFIPVRNILYISTGDVVQW